MKKLISVFSVLLISLLSVMCVAFFAACSDSEKLDANTVYITVLDDKGNPIDGTTFGEGDYNPDNHQVQIQFCTLDGGCTVLTPNVGADGKAEFDLTHIKEFAETNNTDTVELHVLGVTAVGYLKGESGEYGRYKVSEIPQKITVTLKKA